MACFSGPEIVNDGLVLHLDAANSRSYPGSGTAWSDLSGNEYDGTLVNGPIYSSSNNGNIFFDGANDYGEISSRNTSLEFQPTDSFTLSTWFKTTTTPTSGAILSNMVSSSPYTGYDIWFNGNNQIASHLIVNWSADAAKVKIDYNYSNFLNKWTNIVVTYDGSSPTTLANMLSSMNFYTNGDLNNTGKAAGTVGVDGFNSTSSSITYSSTQRFRLASRWANSALSQGSSVVLSNVMIYNRVLTAQEIKQNFEATRSRYGI